ncbi:hypothetical protein EC988_001703 [Linderina pennispora]|nr:hypothetical protein EC988_001703 [Linderina pennispora]
MHKIHTVKISHSTGFSKFVSGTELELTDGRILIIAATTDKEYSTHFETDMAFARRFQRVHVSELTVEETICILRSVKGRYEKHHKIRIKDSALVAAVKLSELYVKDRDFPDKMLDVIDEAMALQSIFSFTKPFSTLSLKSRICLLEAKRAASRYTSGESAKKRISEVDGELVSLRSNVSVEVPTYESLIRFDMSEYMERHQVSRLIRAPSGYKNCKNGGQLTEAVCKQVYSVVLFDEIEKAHPDLTDGRGRVADFSSSIAIPMSNIVQEHLARNICASKGDVEVTDAMHEGVICKFWEKTRSELANRLDQTVVFNPLGHSSLQHVVQLRAKEIEQRLADRNIKITMEDTAIDLVLEKSYGPLFGARPIGRYLEQHLVSELAVAIVRGRLKKKRKFDGWVP